MHKTYNDLASFIITRNRPHILHQTICALFAQTWLPAKILVVDNSDNNDTSDLLTSLYDSRIDYLKVGYNAGPAGAAAIAINSLFNQGFKWVLWTDDDDPPQFDDLLENLYKFGNSLNEGNLGIVGAVGGRFSKKRARMIRFSDQELTGVLEVDAIAGNMFPLIHRNVYNKAVYPDKELFFGFEELDFCLAVKRAGLGIYISGEEMYRHRVKSNRLNLKQNIYLKKSIDSLWREYYGVRNLFHLLYRKEYALIGIFFLVFRTLLKSFYGFRYGYYYGSVNLKYQFKAIYHGCTRQLGMTYLPVKKN